MADHSGNGVRMKIESLSIRNFRVFKSAELSDIPSMAVFLGKNGSGKSTLFDVFGFLHDCLSGGVRRALVRRGGFQEVVSRGESGPIGFSIKFRPSEDEPLITYELEIGLDEKQRPAVTKEVMRLRRGSKGAPWKVLDFSCGQGLAVSGEINSYEDVRREESRSKQSLTAQDSLAVDSLGQLREFPAVASLRRLIDDWYVSDFKVDAARNREDLASDADSLSRTGDNLALVTRQLHDEYPEIFSSIIERMKERVPGVTDVSTAVTQDGYILLRFQDGNFKNPFASKYVSDGTIKMFTYLVLLNSPNRHELLCVEEPENQLYPTLLPVLAEEFREYSEKGGQVFISTHSPDLLNAIAPEELYCLEKGNDGFTTIKRASSMPNVVSLHEAGDKLGWMWIDGSLFADSEGVR